MAIPQRQRASHGDLRAPSKSKPVGLLCEANMQVRRQRKGNVSASLRKRWLELETGDEGKQEICVRNEREASFTITYSGDIMYQGTRGDQGGRWYTTGSALDVGGELVARDDHTQRSRKDGLAHHLIPYDGKSDK